MIRFEWDPKKAQSNIKDHKVSFETAILVFGDPLAKLVLDAKTTKEERWHIIGKANEHLLLLVVHTSKEVDDVEVVRIISAREATPAERKIYENG